MKKKSGMGPYIWLSIIILALLSAAGLYAILKKPAGSGQTGQSGSNTGQSSTAPASSSGEIPALVAATAQEYRAMWVSYLEFETMNFTSEAAFTAEIGGMFDNCSELGLNTVIVHVRPFGDALYPSAYFPYSHILTGTQGQSPGFDPLEIMVREAHARGLRFEALVNPYRVQLNSGKPAVLAASNPAVQNPGFATAAEGGLYYNPALGEVQTLVVNGVKEIVENYDVDGIQFDDYFYPTTAPSFDSHIRPEGVDIAAWRRENINNLIRRVYAAIKEVRQSVTFGISPQGNNNNNYEQQYSDVALWMATPGYVDYVMPQIYWGFAYQNSTSAGKYAFLNCLHEWAAMPRAQGVNLYIGLGAWRIGAGDGGTGDQSEGYSGENMAAMVRAVRGAGGTGGFALFRYANLYPGVAPYAGQEVAALETVLAQEQQAG